MAICPFATKKLIPPGPSDPPIKPRIAILHVDAGGAASLFEYFRDRSGGIESHFHIKWTGEIEQYRDTAFEADANYQANDFAVSIETQGFGGGKWNRRQLASIKRLLTWLNKVHGIPLRRCDAWNGSGVGYHIQFGAPGPWTPVNKSCPGPQRIQQFRDVLEPWMAAPDAQEDAMPDRQTFQDWVRRTPITTEVGKNDTRKDRPLEKVLEDIERTQEANRRELRAINAKLSTLLAGSDDAPKV